MIDAEAAARWLSGGNKCSVTGLAATQAPSLNASCSGVNGLFFFLCRARKGGPNSLKGGKKLITIKIILYLLQVFVVTLGTG